jgi:hypothetical protein
MAAALVTTTKPKITWRMAVASAVGSLISLGFVALVGLSKGNLSYLIPVVSVAYLGLISALETKFPWLSWLLGTLPKPPMEKKPDAPVAKRVRKATKAVKEAPKK